MKTPYSPEYQKDGIYYFFQGWKMIIKPGIRQFVILPIIANVIMMFAFLSMAFFSIKSWLGLGLFYLPIWLSWIQYIAHFLVIATLAIVFAYTFTTFTNIIAAPFNGLLAEQLEAHLTGKSLPKTTLFSILRDLPRILKREAIKLIFYFLWFIGCLLLLLVPFLGVLFSPIIWFLYSAWVFNIQYSDYPFDNHRIRFKTMRNTLWHNKKDGFLFGGMINLFTLIPLFNLVIIPVAVCGATVMWVERYSKHQDEYEDSDMDDILDDIVDADRIDNKHN